MDGREAMALSSGSSPYYIHRGGGIGVSGAQTGLFHTPPGFRSITNPNIPTPSTSRFGSSGPTFSIESSSANFGQCTNVVVPTGVSVSEPAKKKRGRPRKYAPDGQVSLGLSSMLIKSKPSSEDDPLSPRKRRGRPPGSGRKQQLATLGEWMNTSAGIAFSPHVVTVGIGEDVVAKLLSFSQQRPRALCILSGTGTISSVTLRQPASSGPSLTFEGRFEILCLSGSYLVAEEGGPRSRTGGVSASLSSPDGHVIGGAIAVLIAATPVQVVACSFVYGSSKNKEKQVGHLKMDRDSAPEPAEKSTPMRPGIPQHYNPPTVSMWEMGSRSVDLRNPHADIDLTRG